MRRTCCHAYEWAWAECGLNCSLSLALCCACCACRLAEFDCQVALPAATLLSATTRRKCARINMREKNKQSGKGLRDKKRTLPNSFQRFSKQSAATWKIPLQSQKKTSTKTTVDYARLLYTLYTLIYGGNWGRGQVLVRYLSACN